MLTVDNANKIVNMLIKMGYKVLQIGGQNEPKLPLTDFIKSSYFDSVKNILGCKLLLSTDTSIVWAASGYQFPTIILYSNKYYTRQYVKCLYPVNKNSICLDELNVNNIELDKIEEAIKNILNDNK